MSKNGNAGDTAYLSIINEQQNTMVSLSKNLEETIAELTRKLFGASSERTKDAPPQT